MLGFLAKRNEEQRLGEEIGRAGGELAAGNEQTAPRAAQLAGHSEQAALWSAKSSDQVGRRERNPETSQSELERRPSSNIRLDSQYFSPQARQSRGQEPTEESATAGSAEVRESRAASLGGVRERGPKLKFIHHTSVDVYGQLACESPDELSEVCCHLKGERPLRRQLSIREPNADRGSVFARQQDGQRADLALSEEAQTGGKLELIDSESVCSLCSYQMSIREIASQRDRATSVSEENDHELGAAPRRRSSSLELVEQQQVAMEALPDLSGVTCPTEGATSANMQPDDGSGTSGTVDRASLGQGNTKNGDGAALIGGNVDCERRQQRPEWTALGLRASDEVGEINGNQDSKSPRGPAAGQPDTEQKQTAHERAQGGGRAGRRKKFSLERKSSSGTGIINPNWTSAASKRELISPTLRGRVRQTTGAKRDPLAGRLIVINANNVSYTIRGKLNQTRASFAPKRGQIHGILCQSCVKFPLLRLAAAAEVKCCRSR